MKKATVRRGLTASALLGLSLASSMGYAAEGFKVRFPLSGTLGGEMVAPITPGVFGSVVVTHLTVDKLTGPDGNPYSAALGGAAIATVGINQKQDLYNLVLGYTSTEKYADGHLTFAVNVPYVTINRTLTGVATANGTPIGGGTQVLVDNLGRASSGSADSIGDIEASAGWQRQLNDQTKIVVGATLAMPTGDYSKTATAINVGAGNFYTLRTGAAIAYKATENLTLGARASLAFNTKNKDNDWRSGDYYVLDLAAAYRTPIGVVGPHVIRVEQYKDDIGATTILGTAMPGNNRFSSTGAGVFFTTLIPGINAGLNLSYMKTLESRNALSGSFIQARLSKVF